MEHGEQDMGECGIECGIIAVSINRVITLLTVMGTSLFQPDAKVWHSHNNMVAKQYAKSIVKLLATTRTHTILHFH